MKCTKIISAIVSGCLLLGITTACNSKPVVEPIKEELPIDFIATKDNGTLTSARDVMMNYLNYLVKGDYDLALELVDLSSGVLFDADCLQRAVLADGIGRGTGITFYSVEAGEEYLDDDGSTGRMDTDSCYTIDYDLISGTDSSRETVVIYYKKDDNGNYRIDPEGSDWITSGELTFKVPKYVEAYLNGTFIPQTYMGNDYIYVIDKGFPKSKGITLTLKTKFGVSQDYDLMFIGESERYDNSVNDNYYNNRTEISEFKIDVPRVERESALKYLQDTVMPTLLNDMIHGTSWETAGFRKLLGTDSQADAMFPLYYKTARTFADATLKDGGSYYFYDATCYDMTCVDTQAERRGYTNEITDYNCLQLYVEYSYSYIYTRSASAQEYNANNEGNALVTLSYDDAGNWYVYNIEGKGFSLSI